MFPIYTRDEEFLEKSESFPLENIYCFDANSYSEYIGERAQCLLILDSQSAVNMIFLKGMIYGTIYHCMFLNVLGSFCKCLHDFLQSVKGVVRELDINLEAGPPGLQVSYFSCESF